MNTSGWHEHLRTERTKNYLRIAAITRFIAIAGVVIAIQLPGMRPSNYVPFFIVIGIETAANLLYLVVGHKRWPAATFHLSGLIDVAALGFLVYLTGGSNSYFIPLYALLIVFNGIFYGWPGMLSGTIPSAVSYISASVASPDAVSLNAIGVTLGSWAALAFLSSVVGNRERLDRLAFLERNAQLSAIYETSANISNQFEAEALLGVATEKTHELAREMWGPGVVTAVTTLDSELSEMTVVRVGGRPGKVERDRFPYSLVPESLRERLAKRKPYFIGPGEFGQLREWFGLSEKASAIAAPIHVGEELLGTLSVRSDSVMSPSSHQLEALETIANHVGAAMFRVRELEAERRRRQQATELFELARDLRAISSLDACLERIAETSLPIMDAESCLIGLLTDDGLAVKPQAWASAVGRVPSSEEIERVGSVPVEFLREAIGDQRPFEVLSLDGQPEIYKELGELFGCKSGLLLPIMIRGDVAGLLAFGHRQENVRFSIQRLKLGEAIAGLASVAIDNVRLHESEARSAREHTALFEVACLIAETSDITEICVRVAKSSLEATAAAAAEILLVKEDRLVPQVKLEAEKGASSLSSLEAIPFDAALKEFMRAGRTAQVRGSTELPLLADWLGEGGGTRVVAPLVLQEEPIGLLVVEMTTETIEDRGEPLIAGIASLASAAIDHAMKLEAEREAVEQLKELDRLKTEMVSTTSHELRSPLTSISGYAKTLLRSGANFSEEEQREFLGVIDQQAKQLSRLIDELLNVSRIEQGGVLLTFRPIDMHLLLADIIAAAKGRTSSHEFDLEFPPDFPPVVGDEGKLVEIIGNLVDNAIKYSPDGGTITIGGEVLQGEVHLFVRDEGVGIDKEDLDTVFQKFYQVEGRPQAKGSGLGLYIVSELVKAHDGKIWVTSEVGEGTTFHVTLPQRRATDRLAAGRDAVESR
ncbi:MAG: GAF domain-containing protein [Actinobacteria bacterium]|nr:GAF domain-containing protein [Actinomycetota bacterium]